MIVGTAGHIDHGKTSLVGALTGVDTDRLKEEKARGITIELGFAYWPRPDGAVVGFVDVPGHERLVHTMLAGATGIDAVMLVVAADDGVMPQTREHLAIIDLLGLRRGLVAMTKCDLADEERRAEVAAQIEAVLAGTGLEGAPVVPVSVRTGEGLEHLSAQLDAVRAGLVPRVNTGRFRLCVDRIFSLSGAGTVVTGTVVSGRVKVGDQVVVSPRGVRARVRSIHAQNRAADEGGAGDRCAIALVGPDVSVEAIERGSVVLDPSLHAPCARVDASLTVLPGERRKIGQWMPVHFHHGSAEVPARVVVLRDKDLAPGETDFVQIVLERPLALAAGDRYVLRDTSASRTLGGGVLLDLAPPERRRKTPERRGELTALTDPDPVAALSRLLACGGRGFVDLDAYFRERAAPEQAASAAATALGLVAFGAPGATVAMLPATFEAYRRDAVARLTAFHLEKPDLPGLGQERLRLDLKPRLPAAVFALALDRLQREGALVLDRSWARRPDHEVRFSPEEERMWARITPLLGGEARFRPPRVRDIAKLQGIEEAFVRRLFKMAARRGDVDEVAQDHYFLAGTITDLADLARALAAAAPDGRFSAAEFRDRLDNGRKVAIQILEFFDRQGLTMRRGDIRRINPHKATLFSARPAAPQAPQNAANTSRV